MSYFEIGITSGSQEWCGKMRWSVQPFALFWKTAGFLLQWGFGAGSRDELFVQVVIDERARAIRQTVPITEELREHFGADRVERHFLLAAAPHGTAGSICF